MRPPVVVFHELLQLVGSEKLREDHRSERQRDEYAYSKNNRLEVVSVRPQLLHHLNTIEESTILHDVRVSQHAARVFRLA